MAYDEQLAERVRQALGRRRDITERKMFGGVAFMRGGRMCCGIVGHDLIVRVVEAEMPAVMKQRHVRPMDFTGKPLRGFVYVAAQGCSSAATLKTWIARGLRFAASPEAPKKSRQGKVSNRPALARL